MESITQFFNIILYQPLFNVLILLYEYLSFRDLGLAVILLTVLIRVILYPLGVKAIKSQKAMAVLQPKLKEIQEKHKNNKEEKAKATMELYQKEGVNLFSGCLPLLIQFPILIALYWVFLTFQDGLSPDELKFLYSFVPSPQIDTDFLGIINLISPSIPIAVLAGIAQFVQTKTLPLPAFSKNKADISQMMQKQMLYFFPFFTVFILWNFPSVIGLYWLTTTLFSIAQQYLILRAFPQPK